MDFPLGRAVSSHGPARPPRPSQDFFGRVPRWRLRLAGLRFGLVAGHLLRSEVEAALTGVAVALCTSEEPVGWGFGRAVWEVWAGGWSYIFFKNCL